MEQRLRSGTARHAMEGLGLGLVKPGNGGKHKLIGGGRREEGTGKALREIQEIDDHGTGVSREREGEQI